MAFYFSFMLSFGAIYFVLFILLPLMHRPPAAPPQIPSPCPQKKYSQINRQIIINNSIHI